MEALGKIRRKRLTNHPAGERDVFTMAWHVDTMKGQAVDGDCCF